MNYGFKKRKKLKSILQTKEECYLCRRFAGAENVQQLEEHHVFFGTANRKKSTEQGCVVWLCKAHHTSGADAVHRQHRMDLWLKQEAQRAFEENHTREEFRSIFGKSWI